MAQAPASGRVFCYNKGMKKKNFPTIKNVAKVAGIILLIVVTLLRFGSTENGRMTVSYTHLTLPTTPYV